MVAPEPASAPLMLPVFVPIAQLKLLAALDVNVIPVAVPLQILVVTLVVRTGVGLTVTVIVKSGPTHEPLVEVGVTRYCTVPAVAFPGFVNI